MHTGRLVISTVWEPEIDCSGGSNDSTLSLDTARMDRQLFEFEARTRLSARCCRMQRTSTLATGSDTRSVLSVAREGVEVHWLRYHFLYRHFSPARACRSPDIRGFERDRVHDSKHRDTPANADGEREDGGDGKSWGRTQAPKCAAQVLDPHLPSSLRLGNGSFGRQSCHQMENALIPSGGQNPEAHLSDSGKSRANMDRA